MVWEGWVWARVAWEGNGEGGREDVALWWRRSGGREGDGMGGGVDERWVRVGVAGR